MESIYKIYTACWSSVCVLALFLFLRKPADFIISSRTYWRFLTTRWKLWTFVAASALITWVAPYTGDPTWDHVDGFFMSVLCFATAPWVVGVLFFSIRGRISWVETYLALCAWLFSASWSYDIYLVWRDGQYPVTWQSNLFASAVIYFSAGLFWNLEWKSGRGVTFSFMHDNWPERSNASFPWPIIPYAAILALPAVWAVMIFFV